MTAEIVPFGKYKGQPAETLLADADYCSWLTAQPWFRERFPAVYQVVINYGGEPADTPEHNAMQVSFLDDDLCLALAAFVGEPVVSINKRYFESDGWDVVIRVTSRWDTKDNDIGYYTIASNIYVELKPDLGDDFPAVLRQVGRYPYSDGSRCIIVRRHRFEQVTWEQVQQVFASSGIRLLEESDLES